jgi:predicted Zn finger-like uncharacterized protein
MRLVCPNCEAQYEVDDSAIPASGRDVQCSACGHGWYHRPDSRPAAAAVMAAPADAAATPPEPAAGSARGPSDRPVPAEPAPSAEAAPPAGAPPRRPLDASVLAVLREEALREAAARRAEARAPDLPPAGVPDWTAADPRATAARAAVPQASAGLDAARPAPRRDLLPDIEEINSSLSASTERRGPAPEAAAAGPARRGRGGFRTGFLSMLTCIAVLALAYVLAPQLSGQVPALAPAMAGYVDVVDGWRTALSDAVRRAGSALRAATGPAG